MDDKESTDKTKKPEPSSLKNTNELDDLIKEIDAMGVTQTLSK